MRAEGALLDEISSALGVPRATVSQWWVDPDGVKAHARRRKYQRPCPDCGTLMTGASGLGPRAPKRCGPCDRRSLRDDPNRRLERGSPGRLKWSDKQLAEALRTVAQGKPISQLGYDRLRAGSDLLPSGLLICLRFGSWREACAAAGVTPADGTRGPYKRRCTEAACESALVWAYQELGRFPSYSEYAAFARERDLPSGATVRNRLGRWSDITRRLAPGVEAAA